MIVRQKSSRCRLSGAAAVELAFVLPIFCTLTFAQLETARMGMVTQMLTIAARDGARVAVINGKTQTDVQAEINRVLNGTGINVGTITPTPSTWLTDPGGTPITVSLSVPYSEVSWLSPSMYFGATILTATATLSSERP
jgi:Flp pilus assembly protein TadG